MKINKTYKFRIYPDSEQVNLLAQWFGSCRFTYNYFLSEKQKRYKETGKSQSFYDLCKELTILKHKEEYNFLNIINCQTLQASLRHLDYAFSRFYHKIGKYPNFHSKKSRQSFEIHQNIQIENNYFWLPKFKKPIKMKTHNKLEGRICRAILVKYPSGKYYINIITENNLKETTKNLNKEIGIDLGIKDFIITSEGEKFSNPKYFTKYQKRLKIAQQYLSRKKKGSKNSESQRIKVARIQEKIANCRADMQHKLSYYLTRNYSTIYLEDLNIKKMLQNSYLARSISDCGWGNFITMLEYKGIWYNCQIRHIKRFYPSSQICHNCGYQNIILSLKDREWICPNCGSKLDRDINAAINILKEGQLENISAGTVDYTNGETTSLKSLKNTSKQVSEKLEVHASLDCE